MNQDLSNTLDSSWQSENCCNTVVPQKIYHRTPQTDTAARWFPSTGLKVGFYPSREDYLTEATSERLTCSPAIPEHTPPWRYPPCCWLSSEHQQHWIQSRNRPCVGCAVCCLQTTSLEEKACSCLLLTWKVKQWRLISVRFSHLF